MERQAFTFVEIMIVVMIIGMLAALAVPNYRKTREQSHRSRCLDNMRAISSAVEQARMSGISDDPLSAEQLFGIDGYLKTTPVCPAVKLPYTQFEPPLCPSGIAGHSIE